ncbi:hypothetical protein [Flavobacterium sp. UBA4197]
MSGLEKGLYFIGITTGNVATVQKLIIK